MNEIRDRAYGRISCTNLNHRRSDAPVAHCPDCGATVNAGARRTRCTEDAHAIARRQRTTYCVHCGERLIGAPQAFATR